MTSEGPSGGGLGLEKILLREEKKKTRMEKLFLNSTIFYVTARTVTQKIKSNRVYIFIYVETEYRT